MAAQLLNSNRQLGLSIIDGALIAVLIVRDRQSSGAANIQWKHGLRADRYIRLRKLIAELSRIVSKILSIKVYNEGSV